MNKIFGDKRFKYGAFSAVVSIVAIAIFMVVNLIAGVLDRSFDFTKDDSISLSDESRQILSKLDKDVTIYSALSQTGSSVEIERAKQLLDKYKQQSGKISVENIDILLHPDFVKQYSTTDKAVASNSVVVKVGGRSKVINYEDYYEVSYDYSGNAVPKLSLERAVTGAINTLANEAASKLYFVVGHGESDPSLYTSFIKLLEDDGYEYDVINLLDGDVPEDCSALILTPLSRDYSAEEAEKVKSYLASDGRALCVLGGIDKSFVNVKSIINAYGVDISEGYVLEGDTSKYIDAPYAVFPTVNDTESTAKAVKEGYRVLLVASQALGKTAVAKNDTVIEPVLTTSDKSYIKTENASSANKEPGDKSGPFELAYEVTDSTYTDKSHTTKLFVVGASVYLLAPETDMRVSGANSSFLLGAVGWLNDGKESLYIPAKNVLPTSTVLMSEGDIQTVKTVSLAVIPSVLFAAGLIVWLVRRNK